MPSSWNEGASLQGFGESRICLAIGRMAFLSMKKEIKKNEGEKAVIRINSPAVARARERHSDLPGHCGINRLQARRHLLGRQDC